MKITAMEITNKEFKRTMRGYSADEVDEFLDKIAENYEILYKENSTQKEKLSNIEEKINHYNKMESTIQNTLLLAQNAAEQARENAKKESELVLRNANDTAQRIIDKAHSDVIQINDEFDRIKQEFSKFRSKFRNFMESQLEMFDDMEKEFIKNYNIGYESEENLKSKEIELVHDENVNEINEEEENTSNQDTFANNSELEEIKNFFVKD